MTENTVMIFFLLCLFFLLGYFTKMFNDRHQNVQSY